MTEISRTHTVEKIGGTSMSRIRELVDTLFKGGRSASDTYSRVFVVSAFGGITDLLLEHKKSGEPGVYALFASAENDHGWSEKLSRVADAMCDAHADVLDHAGDRAAADGFVRERIEGARSCLIDLQRVCSYGHFRLSQHMAIIRELLSGLGEAHSAFVASLLLRRQGVAARFVDLSGWRDETDVTLDQRIGRALNDIEFSKEMPIVTGYAQCSEGLMREYDRGYSEVTFSRIAALTNAREAIIHKEFHLSSADPKLVGADKVEDPRSYELRRGRSAVEHGDGGDPSLRRKDAEAGKRTPARHQCVRTWSSRNADRRVARRRARAARSWPAAPSMRWSSSSKTWSA